MNAETKRSKIPYIFFAFFGVVFAVNFFYIYLSRQNWRGVVTEDSYQKGVNYNSIIEFDKKQKKLGWKVTIKYQPTAKNRATILVDVVTKEQKPLKSANVTIAFRRPTQEGFDFAQEMKFNGKSYSADVAFPMKGQWDVDVAISKGEDVLHEAKRYVVR